MFRVIAVGSGMLFMRLSPEIIQSKQEQHAAEDKTGTKVDGWIWLNWDGQKGGQSHHYAHIEDYIVCRRKHQRMSTQTFSLD